MREMIESFIKTYGFELQVFKGAMGVFQQDVRNMQACNRRLVLEGAPVRSVGGFALGTDVGNGTLHRLARENVVLSTSKAGSAAVIEIEGLSHSKRLESGLLSALSRLRERRLHNLGSSNESRRSTNSGLNMMTSHELAFARGECDPVIYGPRPTGMLGEAEHRGRLVTFG